MGNCTSCQKDLSEKDGRGTACVSCGTTYHLSCMQREGGCLNPDCASHEVGGGSGDHFGSDLEGMVSGGSNMKRGSSLERALEGPIAAEIVHPSQRVRYPGRQEVIMNRAAQNVDAIAKSIDEGSAFWERYRYATMDMDDTQRSLVDFANAYKELVDEQRRVFANRERFAKPIRLLARVAKWGGLAALAYTAISGSPPVPELGYGYYGSYTNSVLLQQYAQQLHVISTYVAAATGVTVGGQVVESVTNFIVNEKKAIEIGYQKKILLAQYTGEVRQLVADELKLLPPSPKGGKP